MSAPGSAMITPAKVESTLNYDLIQQVQVLLIGLKLFFHPSHRSHPAGLDCLNPIQSQVQAKTIVFVDLSLVATSSSGILLLSFFFASSAIS